MGHYMDTSARLFAGSFATEKEAQEKCAEVLAETLFNLYEPGISEEDLVKKWWSFGDDPWISGPQIGPGNVAFSAHEKAPLFAKVLIEHKGETNS